MPRTTLTAARVEALRPRKTSRDIRDAKLRGFGVRVMPTGRKRFFIQCQHRGERVWKIVGDAGTMSIAEARAAAAEMLAAIRRGEDAPHRPEETVFEAVAATVFERHARLWKAGTLKVNRGYLRNQLLPHFAGRPIADIDRQEVRNWFARLRATPVAADRSMPALSVIMREAEAMGLRLEGSNPCRGIRRYRRKGREHIPTTTVFPAGMWEGSCWIRRELSTDRDTCWERLRWRRCFRSGSRAAAGSTRRRSRRTLRRSRAGWVRSSPWSRTGRASVLSAVLRRGGAEGGTRTHTT